MPAPDLLLVAAPIVFVAYVVFGLCGFGSTLTGMSLLAHFFSLKLIVPVVVLLDCVASICQGLHLRAGVNRRELLYLFPPAFFGLVFGAVLLAKAPPALLLLLLGLFVFSYGVYYAFQRSAPFRLRRWTALPVGLVGGTTASAFGIGGPLFVMYLAARGTSPQGIRATMPVIFIVTTIARIVLFIIVGVMTPDALATAAVLTPAMLLGLWCGNRWHAHVPVGALVRAIGVLVALGGVSLIARAL